MLTQCPQIGERLIYHDGTVGTIIRVENNIAWVKVDKFPEPTPFIWQFKDGLNQCFSHEVKQ